MIETFLGLIEFAAGGVLVCLIVWLKTREAEKIAPAKLKPWIKVVAEIVLSFLAVSLILEPLIPGFPVLTVQVPSSSSIVPGLLENLEVRVTPVGLHRPVGGNRIVYSGFDHDGVAEVLSEVTFFETHVTVEIFDLTQPNQMIRSVTVYINPFVKRQFSVKTITF